MVLLRLTIELPT